MRNDNLITETFSELAPRYEKVIDSELSRFWGWRYEDFVDLLLANTPIHEEDLVLDVATGTGLIPRKISRQNRNGVPVHGLDITPAMLVKAKSIIEEDATHQDRLRFTCASAMSMPYNDQVFDVVLCGLGTHHMDVRMMLEEIYRVLSPRGELSIADVGGYPFWKIPGIKLIIRILAYVYYRFKENSSRAWSEAQGVSNIRSLDEWHNLLIEIGFENIKFERLKSRHIWIPEPIFIRASKRNTGA